MYCYKLPLADVDIADVFHRAFTVGTVIDHGAKQERSRLRAVVDYGRQFLDNNAGKDVEVAAIRDELGIAPPRPSSPEWQDWHQQHRAAAAQLQVRVMNKLQPDKCKVMLRSSASAVGTRLTKLSMWPF